jgi:hypothetical protein
MLEQQEIHAPHAAAKVVIEVNDHPVVLPRHNETGATIKSSAIAQHVPIEQSFQLILKRAGHKPKVIGDNEHIEVHNGEVFRAIPPDDNS